MESLLQMNDTSGSVFVLSLEHDCEVAIVEDSNCQLGVRCRCTTGNLLAVLGGDIVARRHGAVCDRRMSVRERSCGCERMCTGTRTCEVGVHGEGVIRSSYQGNGVVS